MTSLSKLDLFQGLRSAPGVFGSLIMQLQRESQHNPHIPFEAVIEDIRQQAILQEYDKAPPHQINVAIESEDEMSREEFISIYNAMAMTSGYSEALKQLGNPALRARLKIPTQLWRAMSPELQAQIEDISKQLNSSPVISALKSPPTPTTTPNTFPKTVPPSYQA